MLPDAERLRRASLFQRTYAAKKSVSSRFLTLYVLERQPRSAPKLPFAGFVIGKKMESKAVQRNRAKRRVREAYRLLKDKTLTESQQSKLKQWYAIVWVIRTEAITASFDQVSDSVAECIQKAAEKYGSRSFQKKE